MTVQDEKSFKSSNKCWTCGGFFAEGSSKVRDYNHVTSKYRGSVHKDCNINFRLTKIIPVIFHNLRGYHSHLIMQEIRKFNLKINVIPNGLDKYMAFTVNTSSLFIDSMQFMNSSLLLLVLLMLLLDSLKLILTC